MIRPIFPVFTALGTAVAALLLTGCEKPQIRAYTAQKDPPPTTPVPATAAADKTPARSRPRPQVTYTLPAGWEEMGANKASVVNLQIKNEHGKATVNITDLPNMEGKESMVVNLWRSQVEQPALPDEEVAKSFVPVEVAGTTGKLFEVSGANENKGLRIITAFTHRGSDTIFYKIQGDEAVVEAQKPAFLEFLKTVKIKDGDETAAADTTTKEPEPAPAPAPAMVAPDGWQAVPPGAMQFAKFAVTTVEGAKAEVSVSVFPSDTGGTLANVNRWRRQLGLNAIDEAGLQECVTPLGEASIAGAPAAILADLTHENKRMLGAIVPRDGKWWFYKMMGDAAVVGAERENFVHFARNQP